MIHVRTLGALSVDKNGASMALRRKDILLLAYLALRERPVTRTAAAALLWGESTDHAARLSLRQAVWRLRNEIGEALQVTATTLSVDPASVTIDVRQIEQHVDAGCYAEAVDLAAGEFLEGSDTGATNEFEHWVDDVRLRTRQRLSLARQQLVRDAVRVGDWSLAARHAASWSAEAPNDAHAALELARSLRAAGRAAEALAGLTAYARNAGQDIPVEARVEVAQLVQALTREAERPRNGREDTPDGPAEDPHVRLATLWERSASGKSAAAAITGSPFDCSRVYRSFAEWVDARGAGAVVLHAAASRASQTQPWHVLSSIIDGLRNAPGVGGAADDAVAQLAAWAPSIRDRFPRVAVVDPDPARVAGAMRRVIDAVADEVAILIAIENLQYCDAQSAGVLSDLMLTSPARVFFVVTHDAATPLDDSWTAAVSAAATVALPRAPVTRMRARAVVAIAALLCFAVVVAGALLHKRVALKDAGPLAVGYIQVVGERDTLSLAAAVPGLLATKLGLIPELEIISSARMHEIRAMLKAGGDSTTRSSAVARKAGARALIEGELYRQNGEMRLSLRRVNLASGSVDASFEASSNDVFTLVDDVADQIARSLNADLPRRRIGNANTTSIVAYKFYDQGLRAYYQNDYATAYHDFSAALEQDSLFAMAAFYASQSGLTPDASARLFQRARRLARDGGDRDRLLIEAQWAVRVGGLNLFAIADTLTVRYPHEPDGHYYLGVGAIAAGRFALAAQHLQQAVSLDSLALLGRSVPCRACEAIGNLVSVYEWQDSARVAERVARKWVQLQPWSVNAWGALGFNMELQGRFAAAESAFVHAESVQPEQVDLAGHEFGLALRAGRFDAADSIIRMRLSAPDWDIRSSAGSNKIMSMRVQGRMQEAYKATAYARSVEPDSITRIGIMGQHARAMMEVGRFRDAAATYDSAARVIIRVSTGADRRAAAVMLMNEAIALSAIGDTSRLASLENEVKAYGALSVQARDQVLYHHVHGIRQQMAGDLSGAIDSYRRAVYSPTFGNVRASLALGRALIAANRAREAIPVLDAAVRGAMGASGTPIPKSELHEALGRAYEAVGDRGRAAAEYNWVINAWRHGDAPYQARRAQLLKQAQRLADRG